MNKKLISFMGLIALATSCSTGHKNVTTKTPITRIPDKVLVESKRTEIRKYLKLQRSCKQLLL